MALADFFAFISKNGVKGAFEKGKVYYTSRPIEVLIENDFVLDGKNASIVMGYNDFRGNWESVLSFHQRPVMRKILFEDAAKDSLKIKVNSCENIEPGMGIRMTGGHFALSSASYDKGMLNEVVDTLGNGWLLLKDPIPFDFRRRNIEDLDFYEVHKIDIRNLKVGLVGDSERFNYKVFNLELKNLFYAQVKNITIDQPARFGLRGRSFYRCLLDSITINQSNEAPGIYGFGTELFVHTLIRNSSFSANSVSVTSAKYPSYGLTWNKCRFTSKNSAGFDSHGDLEVKVTNSKVDGILLDFGKFVFESCVLTTGDAYNFFMSVGEGGKEELTDILVSNCDFLGQPGDRIFVEGSPDAFMPGNKLVISDSRFRSDKFAFGFLPNILLQNNEVISQQHKYRLPDKPDNEVKPATSYTGFSEGTIATGFDLNGISAFSALVTARFEETSTQCLLGSDNYFFFRFRDNNRIDLSFKGADGQTQLIVFNSVMAMDTLWHTYGFTLCKETAVLYIDGLPADIQSTGFRRMQEYPRVVTIGSRGKGASDYLNGSVSKVVLSTECWSSREMASYYESPSRAKSKFTVLLLENKTASEWLDASGNGLHGTVKGSAELKDKP
jgi:hypothetical protein